jgi:hypothetical protein
MTGITDEMIQKAAVALSTYMSNDPDQWKWYVDKAHLALEAALAGRTVVDLPQTGNDVDVLPTKWDVSILPRGDINRLAWSITVAYRGNDLYAVLIRDHWCLSRSGEAEIEPIPSERTDEWIADHRFPLDEALRLAVSHAPDVACNGKSATEILAWIRDREASGVAGGGAQ